MQRKIIENDYLFTDDPFAKTYDTPMVYFILRRSISNMLTQRKVTYPANVTVAFIVIKSIRL